MKNKILKATALFIPSEATETNIVDEFANWVDGEVEKSTSVDYGVRFEVADMRELVSKVTEGGFSMMVNSFGGDSIIDMTAYDYICIVVSKDFYESIGKHMKGFV